MDLNKYRFAQFKDGARGDGFYDCWGLVREVLYEQFGHPLYSSFGSVNGKDKNQLTQAAEQVQQAVGFGECEAQAGAVACGYVGKRLFHIGVCVEVAGIVKVLHASPDGVRTDSLKGFARVAGSRVVYMSKPVC